MQKVNNKFTHHQLSAESFTDKHGPAIMLEQQGLDEPQSVILHPWQLRAVCEQYGIIASDPQAEKTIATLARRLLLLNHRIQHLDNWLRTLSDSEHADLTYEIGFSGGTADMAGEFCAELVDTAQEDAPGVVPIAMPAAKAPMQASLIDSGDF